jgi:hypothetical protein
MKRFLITAALAVTMLSGAVQAHEGFAMTHHHYWDDWPFNIGTVHSDFDIGDLPPTQAEIDKAIADERACRPLKLYDDSGVHYSRADGCRK